MISTCHRPTTSADENTATPVSKSKRQETLHWTTRTHCNGRIFCTCPCDSVPIKPHPWKMISTLFSRMFWQSHVDSAATRGECASRVYNVAIWYMIDALMTQKGNRENHPRKPTVSITWPTNTTITGRVHTSQTVTVARTTSTSTPVTKVACSRVQVARVRRVHVRRVNDHETRMCMRGGARTVNGGGSSARTSLIAQKNSNSG